LFCRFLFKKKGRGKILTSKDSFIPEAAEISQSLCLSSIGVTIPFFFFRLFGRSAP